LALIAELNKHYSAIVLAVSHEEFRALKWNSIKNDRTIIYDVKGFLEKGEVSARL